MSTAKGSLSTSFASFERAALALWLRDLDRAGIPVVAACFSSNKRLSATPEGLQNAMLNKQMKQSHWFVLRMSLGPINRGPTSLSKYILALSFLL
jgi:hypothetical protein